MKLSIVEWKCMNFKVKSKGSICAQAEAPEIATEISIKSQVAQPVS